MARGEFDTDVVTEAVEEADTVGQKVEVPVSTGEGEGVRRGVSVPVRLVVGESDLEARGEAVVEVHMVGVFTALPSITSEKEDWKWALKLSPQNGE